MSGHFEAKKHAYRQTQDGIVISFTCHPNDVSAEMALAALGTRYMVAFSEIGDDEKPVTPPKVDPDLTAPTRRAAAVLVDAGVTAGKDRRPFSSLPLSQQCAMRCQEVQFTKFMLATHPTVMADEGGVIGAVKDLCEINSRAELDSNSAGAFEWQKLEDDYQSWLTDARYAGSRR